MIIDTDILIDAGRESSTAIACLERSEQHSTPVVSVVTQMELIVGCRNKAELGKFENFLQRFRIIKLTDRISDRAVELLRQYRLSHGLLIADGLIAATALEFNEPLISKNQSDYRFIAGLNFCPIHKCLNCFFPHRFCF